MMNLEELRQFNDELACLVKAGVPLEAGLASVGRQMRGRLGRTMRAIADELQQGGDLQAALTARAAEFPPTYRAAVAMGLQSQRLGAWLDAVSAVMRRLNDLRASLTLALVYPAAIFLVGYGLWLTLLWRVLPELQKTAVAFHVPADPWLLALLRPAESITLWGPFVPLVALGLAWWWDRRSSRRGDSLGLLRGMPTLGRLTVCTRFSALCDMLQILLAGQIPLPMALRLATESSGHAPLQQQGSRLAELLEQGRPHQTELTALHPALAWALAEVPETTMQDRLSRLATIYRERAERISFTLLYYLPVAVSVGLGAGLLVVFGGSFVVPMLRLFQGMVEHALNGGQP